MSTPSKSQVDHVVAKSREFCDSEDGGYRNDRVIVALADERDRLRAELSEAVELLKRAADIMSDAPDDLNGHGEWADDFAKYRYAKYRDGEAQKEQAGVHAPVTDWESNGGCNE